LWGQAVRRQLDDVIGQSGWYKEVTKGLHQMADIVTIDQPGGAGGDGDYATVAAAITALNAADGGTIALREGTYDFASAPSTMTKPINFLAIEDAVVFQNNTTTGAILTYGAGATYTWIRGVAFSEGGSTSGEQIEINGGDNISIEQCNFLGGKILLSATATNLAIRACGFLDGMIDLDTSSGVSHVNIDGCDITGTVLTTPLITVGASFTGKGKVNISNCQIVQSNGSQALVVTSGSAASTTIRDCNILVDPRTSSEPAISYAALGSHLISGTRIQVSTSSDLTAPVLSYNQASTEEASLSINEVTIDFNDALSDPSTIANSPIYLSGANISIRGLKCFDIQLPNNTSGASLANWIELNPVTGGEISLQDLHIWNLSSEGSGSMDCAVIGQASTGAGAGSISLDNCRIDGSDKTFGTVAEGSGMIKVPTGAGADRVSITRCHFTGGTWGEVLWLTGEASLFVNDNRLFFEGNVTPNIGRIADLEAAGTTEGDDSSIVFSDNMIVHHDIQANVPPIAIQNFSRATFNNNNVEFTGAAPSNTVFVTATSASRIVVMGNHIPHDLGTSGGVLVIPDGTPVAIADINHAT
jgi:hypothetical protein